MYPGSSGSDVGTNIEFQCSLVHALMVYGNVSIHIYDSMFSLGYKHLILIKIALNWPRAQKLPIKQAFLLFIYLSIYLSIYLEMGETVYVAMNALTRYLFVRYNIFSFDHCYSKMNLWNFLGSTHYFLFNVFYNSKVI